MRATLGIASAGRPAILRETVAYLLTVMDRDDRLVVCVPAEQDAAALSDMADVRVLLGPRGSSHQRNRIIADALDARSDLVVFFDDDFTPAEDYVARMKAAFVAHEDVTIATGRVIADGILGDPIPFSRSIALLEQARDEREAALQPTHNAYGCNMAARLETIREHAIAFDERLPLYAWLEDVDFSRVLARHGRCVQVLDAVGVHLGTRSGRQPGLRLGYSQIANPSHLVAKGTMGPRRALAQMVRNLMANASGSLRAAGPIDRRGRLKGNLLALADVARGRITPERVLDLDSGAPRLPAALSPQKRN